MKTTLALFCLLAASVPLSAQTVPDPGEVTRPYIRKMDHYGALRALRPLDSLSCAGGRMAQNLYDIASATDPAAGYYASEAAELPADGRLPVPPADLLVVETIGPEDDGHYLILKPGRYLLQYWSPEGVLTGQQEKEVE